jgi:hypothetical protein
MVEEIDGRFQVTCDKCGERETLEATSREVAVLRLIRAAWHVTTSGETLCPGCNPTMTMRRRRFE